ncbi:phosphatidylserine decarboxylase [Mucisphaera calidilacus]|uniref:Phosphatidylserine decarboxylase n=1 Tax=Mucisphaera calidilacus TaxID=2527982 RepID=A0A518BXJ0_9BACT|nr:phosphatidylserine decarboxylase [Mucisphaera calidilacus]QDU71692.1 phosphatidylserine decarboxylase [Mucisphaera calidilacus]
MLCAGARREWITLVVTTALLAAGAAVLGWWWASLMIVVLGGVVLLTFRDPNRNPPSQRGVVVSAADGRVSSIHVLEDCAPLGGRTLCVRVFLSLLNVHVVRIPCYGRIASIEHRPGRYVSALNPASVEENESVTLVIEHPTSQASVAVVRLIAGQFARTVRLFVQEGQTLQRGQRLGIILLGSTAEVYLPDAAVADCVVSEQDRVRAGESVIVGVRGEGSAS